MFVFISTLIVVVVVSISLWLDRDILKERYRRK